MNLRRRGHNSELPVFRYQLDKNAFIKIALYLHVYFFRYLVAICTLLSHVSLCHGAIVSLNKVFTYLLVG